MTDADATRAVHGQAQGLQLAARLESDPSHAPESARLTVDIVIDPGLHIYGLPIPEGFIPLSLDVAPVEGVTVGSATFPPPTPHQMEGLDETLLIYEGRLCVSIPVTLTPQDHDTSLDLKVRYQACGEMGCFMPQTIELQIPVRG